MSFGAQSRSARSRRGLIARLGPGLIVGWGGSNARLLNRCWRRWHCKTLADLRAETRVCQWWAALRNWQASANGDNTPEGWAATQIVNFLADLELGLPAEASFRDSQGMEFGFANKREAGPCLNQLDPARAVLKRCLETWNHHESSTYSSPPIPAKPYLPSQW